MREKAFNNINKLPVRTWSWLGVNDVSMECSFPDINRCDKQYLSYRQQSGLEVTPMDSSIRILSLLDRYNEGYGISYELNDMAKRYYNSGTIIHTGRNVQCQEPVVISYGIDKDLPAVVDNNVIIAEENSELSIIIVYKSEDNIEGFHNGLIRIYAKEGAQINLTVIQMLNEKSNSFSAAAAVVETGAKVNYIDLELGGRNSVVNYRTELKGDGSEGNMNSVYLGDKERTIDLNYIMVHSGRKTLSSIESQGALLDESIKSFKGTLDFRKGAAGSKGREAEYAILLNPKVRNKSVPLLLCGEEEVEGAHAASAGKIDENKLFYLMSRGFNEKEAKKLIIEAAFNPVIDMIPLSEYQQEVREYIKGRLLYE